MSRSVIIAALLSIAAGAFGQMGPGPYPGNGTDHNMMSGEVLAPAAGRRPGASGSQWRTDLWITGLSGSTVTLEFHPIDASSDSATATAEISLSRRTTYLPDVLKNTLNIEQGFGNILLRSTQGVSATVRVYTTDGTGSYGAAFMAMPTSWAMHGNGGMMDDDDLYQIYVLGLLPQPRARVNVVVTNSGSTAIAGRVEILDADGLAASSVNPLPFSIRAFSSHPFNDVLSNVTSRFGDGSAMQIRVRLNNGSSGKLMVITSVTD